MMDKYYKKISGFLSKNHNINKEDETLYEYAIKIIVHGLVNITITILVGALLDMLQECICFVMAFFILRKFTGGYHTKQFKTCLISSALIMSASIVIVGILENKNNKFILSIILFISIIIISLLSPIDNINKPLNIKEKRAYKIISIIISSAIFGFTLIPIEDHINIQLSVAIAQILDSILILFSMINTRISNKNI